jgi:hypothetical protein
MGIVVWIIVFLVVVALSGLLALFKYSPDPWLRTLHEYQSVVGSLVTLFAACRYRQALARKSGYDFGLFRDDWRYTDSGVTKNRK